MCSRQLDSRVWGLRREESIVGVVKCTRIGSGQRERHGDPPLRKRTAKEQVRRRQKAKEWAAMMMVEMMGPVWARG